MRLLHTLPRGQDPGMFLWDVDYSNGLQCLLSGVSSAYG